LPTNADAIADLEPDFPPPLDILSGGGTDRFGFAEKLIELALDEDDHDGEAMLLVKGPLRNVGMRGSLSLRVNPNPFIPIFLFEPALAASVGFADGGKSISGIDSSASSPDGLFALSSDLLGEGDESGGVIGPPGLLVEATSPAS